MKAVYPIVATRFRGAAAVALVKDLAEGETITLIRDAENKHDRNAIQVWARGMHVGFLPSAQNAGLAAAMDRQPGDRTGRFCANNGDRHPMVEIDE